MALIYAPVLPADQTVTSRMVDLTAATADVATEETTTSTSYTNLATVGPAVTPASGVTQDQIITVQSLQTNTTSTSYAYMSPAVSGATAIDDDSNQTIGDGGLATHSRQTLASAVASGSTHSAKYKANANTGDFIRRRIIAVAL